MSAFHIHQNNIREEVLRSDKPVLLDFWAPWCGPCRMVAPILEQIAQERPDIKVGKVTEKGRVLRRAAGARPKSAILAML